MFHIVLYRPEIPPNTGNVMRLCANTGSTLHLIHPLGFSLEEPRLRRAGLDYREWAEVRSHEGLDAFLAEVSPPRLLAFSQHGRRKHSDVAYQPGDALLFGPESAGLPDEVLARADLDEILRIPMLPMRRSLNLANAVAVALYEAWRQQGFPGSI